MGVPVSRGSIAILAVLLLVVPGLVPSADALTVGETLTSVTSVVDAPSLPTYAMLFQNLDGSARIIDQYQTITNSSSTVEVNITEADATSFKIAFPKTFITGTKAYQVPKFELWIGLPNTTDWQEMTPRVTGLNYEVIIDASVTSLTDNFRLRITESAVPWAISSLAAGTKVWGLGDSGSLLLNRAEGLWWNATQWQTSGDGKGLVVNFTPPRGWSNYGSEVRINKTWLNSTFGITNPFFEYGPYGPPVLVINATDNGTYWGVTMPHFSTIGIHDASSGTVDSTIRSYWDEESATLSSGNRVVETVNTTAVAFTTADGNLRVGSCIGGSYSAGYCGDGRTLSGGIRTYGVRTRVTMPSTGYLESFRFKGEGTQCGKGWWGEVYADNSGTMGSLIDTSYTKGATHGAAISYPTVFRNATLLSAGVNYWFVWWVSSQDCTEDTYVSTSSTQGSNSAICESKNDGEWGTSGTNWGHGTAGRYCIIEIVTHDATALWTGSAFQNYAISRSLDKEGLSSGSPSSNATGKYIYWTAATTGLVSLVEVYLASHNNVACPEGTALNAVSIYSASYDRSAGTASLGSNLGTSNALVLRSPESAFGMVPTVITFNTPVSITAGSKYAIKIPEASNGIGCVDFKANNNGDTSLAHGTSTTVVTNQIPEVKIWVGGYTSLAVAKWTSSRLTLTSWVDAYAGRVTTTGGSFPSGTSATAVMYSTLMPAGVTGTVDSGTRTTFTTTGTGDIRVYVNMTGTSTATPSFTNLNLRFTGEYTIANVITRTTGATSETDKWAGNAPIAYASAPILRVYVSSKAQGVQNAVSWNVGQTTATAVTDFGTCPSDLSTLTAGKYCYDAGSQQVYVRSNTASFSAGQSVQAQVNLTWGGQFIMMMPAYVRAGDNLLATGLIKDGSGAVVNNQIVALEIVNTDGTSLPNGIGVGPQYNVQNGNYIAFYTTNYIPPGSYLTQLTFTDVGTGSTLKKSWPILVGTTPTSQVIGNNSLNVYSDGVLYYKFYDARTGIGFDPNFYKFYVSTSTSMPESARVDAGRVPVSVGNTYYLQVKDYFGHVVFPAGGDSWLDTTASNALGTTGSACATLTCTGAPSSAGTPANGRTGAGAGCLDGVTTTAAYCNAAVTPSAQNEQYSYFGTYDLGHVEKINNIRLWFWDGDARYYYGYRVEVAESPAATGWTVLWDSQRNNCAGGGDVPGVTREGTSQAGATSGTVTTGCSSASANMDFRSAQYLNFSSTSVRYVRVFLTGNTVNSGGHLNEFTAPGYACAAYNSATCPLGTVIQGQYATLKVLNPQTWVDVGVTLYQVKIKNTQTDPAYFQLQGNGKNYQSWVLPGEIVDLRVPTDTYSVSVDMYDQNLNPPQVLNYFFNHSASEAPYYYANANTSLPSTGSLCAVQACTDTLTTTGSASNGVTGTAANCMDNSEATSSYCAVTATQTEALTYFGTFDLNRVAKLTNLKLKLYDSDSRYFYGFRVEVSPDPQHLGWFTAYDSRLNDCAGSSPLGATRTGTTAAGSTTAGGANAACVSSASGNINYQGAQTLTMAYPTDVRYVRIFLTGNTVSVNGILHEISAGASVTATTTVDRDQFVWIRGYDLFSVIFAINNANAQIYDQEVNVGVHINNQDSTIQQQTVNIGAFFNNTGTFIGSQLVAMSAALNNTDSNITNQFVYQNTQINNTRTTIENQLVYQNLLLNNTNASIGNQWIFQNQLINNTGSSILNQTALIQQHINNVESNVSTQVNGVSVNITNVNTTMGTQFNNIVSSIENNGVRPPASGSYAYYSLDEPAGSVANDTSGHDFDATINGSAPVWGPAKYGGGLTFNETSQMGNATLTGLGNRTVSVAFWMKPDTTATTYAHPFGLFSFHDFTAYYNPGAGDFRAKVNISGTTYSPQLISSLKNDTWYHIALTYDGDQLKGYVNGTLVSTTAAPGLIRSATPTLRLGSTDSASNGWKGGLDEFWVYGKTLNASEVQALYNNLNPAVLQQFNILSQGVSNANASILTQVNILSGQVTNSETNITTQINQLDVMVQNVETNISSQLTQVNASITNVNSTLVTQTNFIKAQIVNEESNITTQLNSMQLSINNNFSNISSQVNLVSAQIVNQNTNLSTQFNVLSQQVTNSETNITNQTTIIEAKINTVNSTVVNQSNTIQAQIVTQNSNITNQTNSILAAISSSNLTLVNQTNLIVGMIQSFNLNASNQTNIITATILTAEGNITNQTNFISGQIVNQNTNLTTQFNAMNQQVINNGIRGGTDPGLVGYWSFDESSPTATILNDSSIYGHPATMVGTESANWTVGHNGGAFKFDGVNDYASAGPIDYDVMRQGKENESWSLSTWFKANTSQEGTENVILGKNGRHGGLTIDAPNTLRFRVWNTNSSGTTDYKANYVVPDTAWHHAVGTYDNRSMKLYIDGALVDQVTFYGTINNYGTTWSMGGLSADAARGFNGTIDEPRIYKRALSVSEVEALYKGLDSAIISQINVVNVNIQNTNTTIGTQTSQIQAQIISQNSNITTQVNSIIANISSSNLTVVNQTNLIIGQILSQNLNATNQTNLITARITTTESNLTNQTNFIAGQIVTQNTNLTTQFNIVTTSIQNSESNITNQTNLLDAHITVVNSTVVNQTSTIQAQIVTQNSNLTNQTNSILASISSSNLTLVNQTNAILASITSMNLSVANQTNLITATILTTEGNITNQTNFIAGQIVTQNTNLSTQFNLVASKIQNTESNITNQTNLIDVHIETVNSTVKDQSSTIQAQIVTQNSNLTNQTNSILASITSSNLSLINQTNLIVGQILSQNLNATNQTNLITARITTTEGNITNQTNYIVGQIVNQNLNLTNQSNYLTSLVENVGVRPPVDDHTVLYLPLDGAGGVTTTDLAGPYTITIAKGNWTEGRFGNAATFNSANGYATATTTDATTIAKATARGNKAAAAWVNLTGTPKSLIATTKNTGCTTLSCGGSPVPGWSFYTTGAGKLSLELEDATTNSWASQVFSTTNLTVPLNEWAHVAMSYDNTTKFVTMYLNGVSETLGPFNVTDEQGALFHFGGEDTVGVLPSEFPTNGAIDEIWVFNRTLSKNDVEALRKNLNPSIINQLNVLEQTINNTNASIGTQVNLVNTNIDNTRSNITSQVNSLWFSVNNTNSTLGTQINTVQAQIVNQNTNLTTQFSIISTGIQNSESNITNQTTLIDAHISTVNSTVNTQSSTIQAQIVTQNSNITTQVNSILASISSSNLTLVNQTNLIVGMIESFNLNATNQTNIISARIQTTESNLTNQTNLIAGQIVSQNNNLTTQFNVVSTKILNAESNITNQTAIIEAEISTVNSTVVNQSSTIQAQIVSQNSNITTQFNTVLAEIANSNLTVRDQTNLIMGQIVNQNLNATNQTNLITARITTTEGNITNQTNFISGQIVTQNSNISSQFNVLNSQVINNGLRTPVENNLTAYLPLDEGAGLTTADLSPRASTSNLSGSPPPNWAVGYRGSALNFTNVTGQVASGPTIVEGNNWSMEAWVKPTSFTNTFNIFLSSPGTPYLDITPSGQFHVSWFNATGAQLHLYGPAGNAAPGVWYHVLVTHDNQSLTTTLYVNGSQIAQATGVTASVPGTRSMLVGGHGTTAGNAWPFNGLVDEVRIYNRSVSAEEAAAHYYGLSTGVLQQFNIINAGVTNTNLTLGTQVNTVQAQIVAQNVNLTSQYNSIVASITSTNLTAINQTNAILASISSQNLNATNQTNLITGTIRTTEGNITNQTNFIAGQIVTQNTNLTTQFNLVSTKIQNTESNITNQTNALTLLINNTNASIGTQVNSVLVEVQNTNASLAAQLNALSAQVTNSNATILDQVNIIWAAVNNTNSSITTQLNGVSARITVFESNVNTSFAVLQSNISYTNTTILNNITQMNATLYGRLLEVLDGIDASASDAFNQTTSILQNLTSTQSTLNQSIIDHTLQILNDATAKELAVLENITSSKTALDGRIIERTIMVLDSLTNRSNDAFNQTTSILANISQTKSQLNESLLNRTFEILADAQQHEINILENLTSLNVTFNESIFRKATDILDAIGNRSMAAQNQTLSILENLTSTESRMNQTVLNNALSVINDASTRQLSVLENITTARTTLDSRVVERTIMVLDSITNRSNDAFNQTNAILLNLSTVETHLNDSILDRTFEIINDAESRQLAVLANITSSRIELNATIFSKAVEVLSAIQNRSDDAFNQTASIIQNMTTSEGNLTDEIRAQALGILADAATRSDEVLNATDFILSNLTALQDSLDASVAAMRGTDVNASLTNLQASLYAVQTALESSIDNSTAQQILAALQYGVIVMPGLGENDTTAPTSVLFTTPTFGAYGNITVTWTATDSQSPIAWVSVYGRLAGTDWVLLVDHGPSRGSTQFKGAVEDQLYEFKSVSADIRGNVEPEFSSELTGRNYILMRYRFGDADRFEFQPPNSTEELRQDLIKKPFLTPGVELPAALIMLAGLALALRRRRK